MVRWSVCAAALALLPCGSVALRTGHAQSSSSFAAASEATPKRAAPRKAARGDGPLGSSFAAKGHRDLVLMHIPYNFGHTVEKVAMMPKHTPQWKFWEYASHAGKLFTTVHKIPWSVTRKYARSDGEVWGHVNPDLMGINEETGCNNFFTPQKYWPEELAQSYFGNKTVFGMLRDPAERLVALFRGNLHDYGGSFNKRYHETCDVNNAIKEALKGFLASGNKFHEACTFLPQAEYFDGPHGITLPVDNRRFPESMNEVFRAHHYDMQIDTVDLIHVHACQNIWAADLDGETRGLIRKIYARDYELLCKHFGYCDPDQNTCIKGVPEMCPGYVLAQGLHAVPR